MGLANGIMECEREGSHLQPCILCVSVFSNASLCWGAHAGFKWVGPVHRKTFPTVPVILPSCQHEQDFTQLTYQVESFGVQVLGGTAFPVFIPDPLWRSLPGPSGTRQGPSTCAFSTLLRAEFLGPAWG